MSATDPESRTHRGPFYCQFYSTYLPPSYLPPKCQETVDTYPQWPWSLLSTVFVSATTVVNTTICLAITFLWLVNRQFHFKKGKHSYDKKPLQPLKKPAKALKKAGASFKNAAKKLKRKKKGQVEGVSQYGEQVVPLLDGEAKPLSEQSSFKSFQSFLEDVEEEDEDDEAIDKSLANDIRKRDGVINPSMISQQEASSTKKRLLHLASKIEVFSYLSPDALMDILEYVEYVDFKNVGDVIFDTKSWDGSMYCVVSGEATTSLSIQHKIGDVVLDSASQDFSFVAGPGEVLTSMLTIITSLVREYQLQDALLHALIPGVIGGRAGIGGNDAVGNNKIIIPKGMNVKSIVTRPNTRLLRIPSRCFVAILEKFPKDVHNICQTIMARLQRVTIQTLVRFLGLDAGLLGLGDSSVASLGSTIPEKKPRHVTAEWSNFEQSLPGDLRSKETASTLLEQAILASGSMLGLTAEESQELKDGTTIVHPSPGGVICSKGEPPDAIYLILKGSLEVGLERGVASTVKGATNGDIGQNGEYKKAKRSKNSDSSSVAGQDQEQRQSATASFKPLFSSTPGNWVGLFSCFTHDASFITVHANSSATTLLKIPASTFEKVISNHPRALIHCLLDIIDTIGDSESLCVSPSMFLLDMSLDWMHVDAGEYITTMGEPCDSVYVVLNGRLQADSPKGDDPSKPQANLEEYGRGATIGELEALAEGRWTQNIFAKRHCEVARIPNQIINILMELHPSAALHFAKVIASQIQSRSRKGLEGPAKSTTSLLPSYGLPVATVAVVPLTEQVDVSEFCAFLSNSMSQIAPTILITKSNTKERVGQDFFQHRNAMLKVKLTRILGDIEESNRLVIYQSDYKFTWWSKLCIQQADCVLVLVDSQNSPELKRAEDCLAWANMKKNVRIELAVVQSASAQEDLRDSEEHASDDLNNWSEQRPWISRQHLIRCEFAKHEKDFCRMSRRITGQSVGLVMGGGGARGLAHLGIIKALNEVGIPIDLVGGTSQGAFVGALLARNPDNEALLIESVHEMASDMSSVSNKLRDLTFPLTSFFSGHHFNRGIKRVIGANVRIQDFVLNFFCVSVDICNSVQVVHTKGLAWKYVRASMSLTGYLPPVSENNSLLVDGGYMNVVPADVMAAEFGAKKIIAVDVSAEDKTVFYEYGTELSGFWLLCNSWNPFVQTVKVPSMGDINERLAWVSSERTKKEVIKNKVDLFLRPPVNHFGTLEYDKIDEIVQIGYEYALPLIEEFAEENGY